MKTIFKIFPKILFLICIYSNAFSDATFVQGKELHDARTIQGIKFNSNGDVLHVVSSQAAGNNINTSSIDKVYRYTLSTDFDISTTSDTATKLDIRDGDICASNFQQPTAIAFNNLGSRMFVGNSLDGGTLDVCQVNLDSEFDAPSGVTPMATRGITVDSGATDVGDAASAVDGLEFNSTGSKMFLTNMETDKIYEFNLTSNYDVSTASYSNNFFEPTDDSASDIEGIAFNDDGTMLYFVEGELDYILQYELGNAYDLSSSKTYKGKLEIRPNYLTLSTEDAGHVHTEGVASQMTFNNDGTKLYVSTGQAIKNGNGITSRHFILEYNLSPAYKIYSEPELASSSPSDGATSVGVNDNITLTFDESVNAVSGNITIKKCSDESTIETIDVTGTKVSGSGSTTITLDPSSTLDHDTCYYINIDDTAFDDNEGNSYAGISNSTTLNFTTEGTTASSNPETKPNPLINKDVVALIEAQTQAPKELVQHITTPIFNRLYWLKEYQKGNDLLAQNLKLKFFNSDVDKISKVLQASTQKNEDLNDTNKDIEKWLFWSEGSISIGRVGDTSLSSSKEVKSDGVTFGIDKLLNNDSTIGYALRFNKDDVDVGDLGTSLDTNAKSFSIYGNIPLDYNEYFETIIGFNTLSLEIIRVDGSNTLTGNRDGKQIYGSIRYVGINEQENFNFSPNIKLDFSETSLSEYSEIGSSPLTYQKQNVQTANLYSGFVISNKINKNNFTLRPNAGIEFGIDLSPSSDVKLNYVSDPNTVYVKSIDKKNETLNTSLGLDITSNNGLSILLLYKRNQNNNAYSDTIYIGAGYVPSLHTEYTMSLDERMAKLQYDKKLENKVISLNTKYDLSKTKPNHEINLNLSSNF